MNAPDTDLRSRRFWAYENPRPEVQELVPLDARRILDVGCSSGALGAALKLRQQASVTGIELESDYAEDAADRLDRVVVADVEQLKPEEVGELGEFDCVIAADVLEHLRDPWSVLDTLVGRLRIGGTAVISVPNIRYWETFWVLFRRGTWPLRDEGIFDRGHLRWFTRADAVHLMEEAGLAVTRIEPQYRLRPSRFEPSDRASKLARTKLAPFVTFQYVLAGDKIAR